VCTNCQEVGQASFRKPVELDQDEKYAVELFRIEVEDKPCGLVGTEEPLPLVIT